MADENLPSRRTQQVAEFFRKIQSTPRARLIFALDATQSRQPTWDTACRLQAEMFQEAGRSGALEIQMVYGCPNAVIRAGRPTRATWPT